jgi:NAD(P)-dependent dehydrogenase (short-subunit alcohol dehydrogenase family)
VVEGLDLSTKRVVVTGGSSGLGLEAARALARTGAKVTLAVRDTTAGVHAAEDIADTARNARVRTAPLDLADPASIARFAREWEGSLDVLVNAAEITRPALERTREGWERQFAVNHLGHFALAHGLHDALASAHDGARIVTLSASGHLYSPVIFEDVHFDYRPYADVLAYGQSKTANILFGVAAAQRWTGDGIVAAAAIPGPTHTSPQRAFDPQRLRAILGGRDLIADDVPPGFKTPQQGAATLVLLAASPLLQDIGGRCFEDCAEAVEVATANGYRGGVAPFALDPELADRLWEESVRMLAA